MYKKQDIFCVNAGFVCLLQSNSTSPSNKDQCLLLDAEKTAGWMKGYTTASEALTCSL